MRLAPVSMLQLGFGEQVISTGLSPRYQESWGAVEALREIIQEVLDARNRHGCRICISWSRGRAVIEDNGPGFDRAALALGHSTKRDDGKQIGQFGEGMKLALLVLARSGRGAMVETVGFTVRSFLATDPALGCKTLHLSIRENTRTRGTRFEVEATKEELAQARRYFLALDPDRPKPVSCRFPAVMLPPGRVYVNGVLAAEIPDLAFSYALSGEEAKALQNRDRSVVSAPALKAVLWDVWGKAPASVLALLLRTAESKEGKFEHSLAPRISSEKARAAARLAWPGQRVAQEGYDSSAAAYIQEMAGYKIVSLPYEWQWAFRAGVPFAADVAKTIRQRAARVKMSELTPEERANLAFARRVVERWVGQPGQIRVAEWILFGAQEALGTCDLSNGRITVARKALSSKDTALAVLVHETLHRISGAADKTLQFEKAWEELAVRLLLMRDKEAAS